MGGDKDNKSGIPTSGDADDADYALDLTAENDSDDDIMAMLEKESRKTGSNKTITPEDLAEYNDKLAQDAHPENQSDELSVPAMPEVEDAEDEDKLLQEWNDTTSRHKAIRPEDLK